MPKQMAFSGTIWMLELHHRVRPVDKMDFARIRCALEQMVERQSVNKVLGTVVVRAESVLGEGGFKYLQRVERDADIDAVVLAIYWNKPWEADVGHPWMSELRDLMFSAQPVGSGVEVIVDGLLSTRKRRRSKKS